MSNTSNLSIPKVDSIKAKGRKRAKKRDESNAWVRRTFMIPRPTDDRLRDLAYGRKTSVQQILEEMADEWLSRQNEPGFYPDGFEQITKRATLG